MTNNDNQTRYRICIANQPGCLLSLAIAATLGSTLLSDAHGAGIGDFFGNTDPYVAVGFTYDSNVFRVEDEDEMVALFGTPDESDNITNIEAGFDTELKYTNKKLILDGKVVRTEFADFSAFSHTAGQARGLLEWTTNGAWRGDFGYRFDQRLRAFANQPLPSQDLRKEHELSTQLFRRLTTRWEVGVTAAGADISFDDSPELDQTRTRAGVNFRYSSRLDNSVTLAADVVDGNFDSVGVRDYQQWSAGPGLEWRLTQQTRLMSEVRFTEREQDNPLKSDFSGVTGRLTLVRRSKSTGNGFRAMIWRDISNLQDEIDDFAVISGIQIEPVKRIGGKTQLRFTAAYENRDFKSNVAGPIATSSREDDVYLAGVSIDWQATDKIGLSLGYMHDERSSNRLLEEYDSDSVTARIEVGL